LKGKYTHRNLKKRKTEARGIKSGPFWKRV